MDYCNVVLVVHLGYSEPSAIRHSLAFDFDIDLKKMESLLFLSFSVSLVFCSPEIEKIDTSCKCQHC